MKLETEIRNQWRILRKIYNNGNETFDWDDLKSAIETLIDMERLKINPDYFDEEEPNSIDDDGNLIRIGYR